MLGELTQDITPAGQGMEGFSKSDGAPSSPSGWVSAPFVLVPSDGVFGRFDLAALRGCHTLNVCLFVCLGFGTSHLIGWASRSY
jgi:hypothetical protein